MVIKPRFIIRSKKYPHTRLRLAEAVKLYGPLCYYCGTNGSTYKMTVDHVVPLHAGGPDSSANWVPCCLPCNQAKGAYVPRPGAFAEQLEEIRAYVRPRRDRVL